MSNKGIDYYSKYLKYKKKYLDLKAGAALISNQESDVVTRKKGIHSLRFSNEISKLSPNLLEYEQDPNNEDNVISQKLPNSTSFYKLTMFIDTISRQCEMLLEGILDKDEDFAHYEKITNKYINKNKENEKPLFRWISNKINEKLLPAIDEARTIVKNGTLGDESIEEKSSELLRKHFEGFVILPERIISEFIEAVRLIITNKWILKDFNKGNIVFYYESLPNEGDDLNSFFNDNLQFKLIDWKYVFSPEQNEETNFSAWDSGDLLIANMLPMKSNLKYFNKLLLGNIHPYIEEFDKIINEYRK